MYFFYVKRGTGRGLFRCLSLLNVHLLDVLLVKNQIKAQRVLLMARPKKKQELGVGAFPTDSHRF